MVARLSQSFHIEFKGFHHTPTTYWDKPCAMQMAKAFLNDSSEKPQDRCFDAIGSILFE